MGYFLMMTWPWWLLAIAISVLGILLISRWWAAWNWPAADRDAGELAAAKARIAELESQLNDVPTLKALIAELEAADARAGESVSR